MNLHRSTLNQRHVGFAAAILAAAPFLRAQGPLNPPGAPAPSMKSLQQIWDKVAALETQNQMLMSQTQSLTLQNQSLLNSMAAQQTALGAMLAQLGDMPWVLSTVDAIGDAGKYSSLDYTPAGHPAVTYFDRTNGNLKYAVFNGSVWTTSTVDQMDVPGGHGNPTSLAFTPGGQPAVCYFDETRRQMKYAEHDGTKWQISALVSGGSYSSLAFTPAGIPAISYQMAGRLFYAERSRGWVHTLVDEIPGNLGLGLGFYASLAFSPAGQPTISYSVFDTSKLKFASFDGTKWAITVLDDSLGAGSLAYSPAGQPAIAYAGLNDNIKYAILINGQWSIQTVDNDSGWPGFISLAFSPSGQPGISYMKDPAEVLKYATYAYGAWRRVTVDESGNVGQPTSLAFTPGGQPSISYWDSTNGDLKFAVRQPAQ